ncbi:alpha/beta fold hydrolase [Pseudoduganella sp.]|uniref:alpha/beta fold hydrolase n=1 Tax=Pseudoduganella sp. TaxID=1880898 RepID=UPI0035B2E1B2
MARLKPALVLLPGMDGSGMLFAPLIKALGEGQRVIQLSYPHDRVLNYDALVQLARQALPDDAPYVLLGESFSGPIAITLAAQHPPGLLGLVLCCTFAANPRPALRRLGWLVHGALVKPAASQLAAPLLLGRAGDAEARALLVRALAPVTGAVLAQRVRAVLAVDVSAALPAVAVPIHYLQAQRDRLVPPRCAVEIARWHPQVVLHAVDGPHCLLQAAPAACAALLRAILAELGSASA